MNKTRIAGWIVSWALTGALACATAPGAQNSQPTLDELLDLPAQPADRTGPSPDAVDPTVQRRLAGNDPADLLEQALAQMGDAADRLAQRADAGVETQRMQRAVLDKLDQVIEAARRRQQQQSGGGGAGSARGQDTGSSGNTARGRAEAGGGSEPGAAAAASGAGGQASDGASATMATADHASGRPLSELRSEWGNLPPRLRDELLQGLGEKFSAIYQSLTEEYYRRLAEQDK